MNEQEKIHREKLVKTLKHLENYALMLTHDRDRANDLLQETFLRIIQNRICASRIVKAIKPANSNICIPK